MNNKSKNELLEIIEDLQQKVEKLENDVDYWQSEYDELEIERDNLQEQLDNIEEYQDIKDLDNFKFKLKTENLYSDKLEEFIKNYIKYYNN